MAKEITVTLYLNNKPIETLTPEQSERMAQRLSKEMSKYYTNHPEKRKELRNA
jgi:hypothetical protein